MAPKYRLVDLAAAEEARTVCWEAVLLLGSDEAVLAGRRWHQSVFQLELIASGRPADLSRDLVVKATSEARGRFYEAARRDIGHPVGDPLSGHTDTVRAVAALPQPDGRVLLATGSIEGTVRIWDPADGSEMVYLVAGAPVSGVCTHPTTDLHGRRGFLAFCGPAGLALVDLQRAPDSLTYAG